MTKKYAYDAVVIGSGPNGLAAGIALAKAGLSVILFEAKQSIGGGMRSAELTLPGFIHDVCSAIHPLAIDSPFFRSLPLSQFGLEWIHPLAPLAHPFDDGSVSLLERSIEDTGKTLGPDFISYQKIIMPLIENWNKLQRDLLAPLHFPFHPVLLTRFALNAIQPAEVFVKNKFSSEHTRAFFAGLAAHSFLPLHWHLTTAFALILGTLGHVVGWPFPCGGSQKLANALSSYFQSLGGQIVMGMTIEKMSDLPSAHAFLFDVSPKQLINIAGEVLPNHYVKKLKKYRYGPGICKVDWALSNPIPWKSSDCAKAGTVHLGGSLEEIVQSERQIWEGKVVDRPFVLVAQQSLFDSTRAPNHQHTGWAYCHVPNGSQFDMTSRIERQIVRFAPGFIDCIIGRKTCLANELEEYNLNCLGGDINGGVQDIYQLFARPVLRLNPYTTPVENIYICSSSTPPGGGVHGMCGYFAAKSALSRIFQK